MSLGDMAINERQEITRDQISVPREAVCQDSQHYM